ncbi:STAS domain-containing protein [Carboxylicivirga sp. A043]|uniref:STAS domain-containing protein n=1 Tax=Carboxylicivirga litoralis TaxID=2816963 RepID=UPI0021CB8DB7|nr:STAS domain-containing protein [Carboxylicivirga sp. A043]MCU4155169.1 STAS domain-containing protein [Carboxylicivirga sp. A043]
MDKLPYTVIHDELPEQTILRFSGQLIINHIEKIAEAVKSRLKTDKDLQIEIDNPESVDVTFIQLVLSLKATLKANGKTTTIISELKPELQTLVKNSGFQYVLN